MARKVKDEKPKIAVAQPCRSTIKVLILPIASAGFSPFGQARVQFIMVWQR